MIYAVYNKKRVAESASPYDLVKAIKLIVTAPAKKISIYDNEHNLLVKSKFYSKLDKWADIYYRTHNTKFFVVKPLPSDMDDNDETEFYL